MFEMKVYSSMNYLTSMHNIEHWIFIIYFNLCEFGGRNPNSLYPNAHDVPVVPRDHLNMHKIKVRQKMSKTNKLSSLEPVKDQIGYTFTVHIRRKKIVLSFVVCMIVQNSFSIQESLSLNFRHHSLEDIF